MEIQTLSIVVPAGCPNKCRFCVSRLHSDDGYVNQIEKNRRFKDLYKKDFIKRLFFARDNGCNTIIYTGDGEPLLNMNFLEDTATWNEGLASPFKWIELQTSGVTLNDEKLRWLRNMIGVSTISLSLSSMWNPEENALYNGTPRDLIVDIEKLCSEIKKYDFNLRLSLNMTDFYDNRNAGEIFRRLVSLGANQVTFRVLYSSPDPDTGEEVEIDTWIKEHSCKKEVIDEIKKYILKNGRKLERLPYGAMRYSVNNISTVIDEDCMSTEAKETLKYLILRPNCKLYTKWDDQGSLLF